MGTDRGEKSQSNIFAISLARIIFVRYIINDSNMSASSLLNIEGDIFLPCAVSAPAVSASLLQSGRGFSIVYAGEASIAVGAPGTLAVAVPGVVATDIVITTVNGSTTPANLLVGCAGVATADTVTLTATVDTSAMIVGFLVIRLN